MESDSPPQSPKEDRKTEVMTENGNSNGEPSNEDRALQEALEAAEREYQKQMEEDAKQSESKKEENQDEEEDEGKNEEENEEEEAPGFIAPVIDGRTITFKTKMLNEFLLCSLCMGYFRDANTVKECLHTFCKSCIYKWFMDRADCPRCGVSLGTNPFDLVKFDRQLQTIVDKILPHLEKADLAIEREFYKERGIPFEEPQSTKSTESGVKRANENNEDEKGHEPKRIKKSEALKKFYADEIGFELNLDESEVNKNLGRLRKPFIRTSAKVTVMHLKKYIKQKLGIEFTDYNQMEITYRGEVLGNEHSLEYILKSRGGFDNQGKTPCFKYRWRRNDIL